MAKTSAATVDSPEFEKEHQVLYRKFRPRQFADVVGQDHIIKPLQSKVAEHKVGHAYLFVGPRGCGKTTTARLLAAASNCPNVSAAGEPCGECATCNGIINGSGAIGLHELDAASNRGVGDMLSLIETMGQGSVARKKVYIIDEAHMLTKEASNALLKTLEEPPADTLIILATTEANKVLPTIQSRAVRYNFKLIDPVVMTGLIKEVVKATGIEIDEAGIAEVVRRGHGSPRDTLTALEGYGGEEAGDDVISFVPGIASALVNKDSADLIISIAEAINAGVDVPDLTRSLLAHWRNCLLALEAPSALDMTDKEVAVLAKQAKALKPNRVVRLLNVTSEALGKMATSGDERLLLETTLLQIALPSASDSIDGIYEILEEMQDTLDDIRKKGVPTSSVVASAGAADWPPIEEEEPLVAKPVVKAVEAKPEPVEVVEEEPVAEEVTSDNEDEEDSRDHSDEETDSSSASDEPDPADEDEDDYSQLDDSKSDDDEDDETSSSDYDDFDDDKTEEDEQVNDISDLLGDPIEEDGDENSEDDGPVHNHDADDESGFLECSHPDCVEKNERLEKGSKAALKDQKSRKADKEDHKDEVRMFFDEDNAPTAADLVERIQHDIVDRKFSRYLQDTVMEAELEDDKNKTYLVLTLKKNSSRVPTKEAVDAIIASAKYLWVDGVDYEGEER